MCGFISGLINPRVYLWAFYFLVIYSPTYIVHFETIANGTVFISFADWSLLLYSNMTDVCELLFYPISI